MSCLHRNIALWAVVALMASADCAFAGQRAGGGGGRSSSNNPGQKHEQMRWFQSLAKALEAAKTEGIAVMTVLRRPGNLEDQKAVEKLASWPEVIKLSREGLAAVRLNAEGTKAEELSAKVKLPSLPAILWLDQYGNAILGQPMPETADSIVSVLANWKSTLDAIDKFFKEHNGQAEKFLQRGKLREAYFEFALGKPFKGPEPERARAGQQKVRERWEQLLKVAAGFPAPSLSRAATLKGLRADAQGTDYAAALEEAIQKTGAPAQVAAADKPAGTAGAVAAAGLTPQDPQAVEEKPLTEVIRTRAGAQEQPSEDAGVDTRFLGSKSDTRLKDADKLLQDGLAEFRKATADNADRGEARNGLLRSAHAKFDKALALLEWASAGKPDAPTEKLMERVSMLMYGCLKYQSL